MRKRLNIACGLVALLIAGSAAAQETRGTISGTVRDMDSVLPGANVTITNTGTTVSQQLVTNGSGYFEETAASPRFIQLVTKLTF
jgi:hypothetical protein